MIFIVDSGATKADWVAIDNSGDKLFFTQTPGLNPEVLTKDILKERLINNKDLEMSKSNVRSVFFYGAGCGTSRMQDFINGILKEYFPNAEIHVHEDTHAAIFASIDKKEHPAVVSIIGTGSNCSFWNGKEVVQKVHSLGYSLMDDCSGNYFGKQLIRDYYFNKMPKKLASKLSQQFDLGADVIKENLYKEPNPNRYLATFARFIIENRTDEFCRASILEGLNLFYKNYVSQFEQHKEVPCHFIGSIAHYLSEELQEVMEAYGVTVGNILRKPIDGLLEYHRAHNL